MHNHSQMRCATYARFSPGENQREASIHDQLRKCRDYADSKGWTILSEHIYSDQHMSGAGIDRPGLNRLLECAFRKGQAAFDVVLVDDTSRLSRDLADAIRISQRLRFEGIRLVAVSQNIDTADDQSDVMFTVHGLVDSLYIKELAKKTHRGLEGLALQGLHTGGRCYGYDIVDAADNRKRYKINEAEAQTVNRIFGLAARGVSLKQIAKELNQEGVRPPRPGSRKKYNSWCPSAIRDMLRREIYVGRLVWNKSRWVKAPGTNRRLRRPRPKSEWITIKQSELRIVTNELWDAVRAKNERTMARYSEGAKKGLARRADTVPHIMSGFLTCGECGANMVIVSGRGGRYARYGCAQAWNRGACSNKLTIKLDDVERIFFSELQQYAISTNGIDQVLGEFVRQLAITSSERDASEKHLQGERKAIQQELDNFMTALAEGITAKSLRTAISEREHALQKVEAKLDQVKRFKPRIDLLELKNFVTKKLFDVVALLKVDRLRAKNELRKHLEELRMIPTRADDGRQYYSGEGRWEIGAGSIWMNDCKAFKTEVEGSREAVESKGQVSSVRSVAGGGFEPPTFGL